MDINIIGPGVVGRATGEAWRRFGHNIEYTDAGEGFNIESDLFVICTPEDVVESVLIRLSEGMGGETFSRCEIIVRSSTPPGTVQRLAQRYGISLWHNPEFLREATAEQDLLQSTYALIGYAPATATSDRHCNGLYFVYTGMGIAPIYCTSTESEFVKLATNCYLATQVSFWNELKRITDKLGINSHSVAKLATLDPRVSPYGALMHGQAYGGKCLPKDMDQMIRLASDLGLQKPFLLTMVHALNETVRKGEFFE